MTYELFAENVCQDQVVESKNANRSAFCNRAGSLLKLVTGEAAAHLCCQPSRASDTARPLCQPRMAAVRLTPIFRSALARAEAFPTAFPRSSSSQTAAQIQP